jgi:hypothetical protein
MFNSYKIQITTNKYSTCGTNAEKRLEFAKVFVACHKTCSVNQFEFFVQLCITFYSEHFNNYNEKSIPAPESRDCENLSTGTTVPEKVRDPGIPVFGIPGLEALGRNHKKNSG